MKRIAIALLTSAAVVGLSQAASAADLAVKAAPPAPAPVATWTGFYIGVHGGGAWQNSPNWSFVDPNFVPGVTGIVPQTLTAQTALGGVGGLQAGYNWQFAPAWVAGIEGDISWTSLGQSIGVNVPTGASGIRAPIALTMSENTRWLASARARLGFTGWGNGLYYATGGVAWADTEYDGATLNQETNIRFGNSHHYVSETTKTGWVVGGGAEYQVTQNILLRGEYLYYKFNNGFTGTASGTTIAGLPLTTLPVNFTWNSYNVQVARVAVSYKF